MEYYVSISSFENSFDQPLWTSSKGQKEKGGGNPNQNDLGLLNTTRRFQPRGVLMPPHPGGPLLFAR